MYYGIVAFSFSHSCLAPALLCKKVGNKKEITDSVGPFFGGSPFSIRQMPPAARKLLGAVLVALLGVAAGAVRNRAAVELWSERFDGRKVYPTSSSWLKLV